MTARIRMASLGTFTVAALGLIYAVGQSSAGDAKELYPQVEKIAGMLQKGDKDGAAKAAQALGKKLDADSFHEIMHIFKPRKKGGRGVGKAGDVVPDGIELKIVAMKRDAPTPTTLKKEAAAIEEMGYVSAAMGLITQNAAHTNDRAKKSSKDWVDYSKEMYEASLAMAAAAKAMGGGELKTATGKVDTACNACHSKYR